MAPAFEKTRVPFTEAVWGMQADYVDEQAETLVEGCFTDWL